MPNKNYGNIVFLENNIVFLGVKFPRRDLVLGKFTLFHNHPSENSHVKNSYTEEWHSKGDLS